MEILSQGGQSIVYKLDDNYVFKQYKLDKEYPIDFKIIKILCNEIGKLNRVITPIKIDYNRNDKIVGTYCKYIQSYQLELVNVSCSTFYQWYTELIDDVKKISSKKIRMLDFVYWNFIMSENGPYFIDVESFVFSQEKDIEEIEKDNIADLNYCFLYGFLGKIGHFVTSQTFNEIFDEIKNFNGTLSEYVQYKKSYDYETYTSNKKM